MKAKNFYDEIYSILDDQFELSSGDSNDSEEEEEIERPKTNLKYKEKLEMYKKYNMEMQNPNIKVQKW